ncbi:hypothetical protein BBJ28_00020055 [Nothophytophthora sp. Chile5]|nr:hypothetical protein BBJ28_00020055 [Nothophytophthora sp. Chile5]
MKLARHELIHNDSTRSSYSDALKQKLPSPNFDDGNPINAQWDVTFAKIQETAMQTIGFSSPSQRRKGKYNDPVLAKLSEQQRQLRLRIYNDKATITTDLRSRRNRLLHQIRDRCCELANNVLDDKISRIESTSGSHQMFTAVRDISYRKPQQLLLRDEAGKYILHRQTANNIVRDHFKGQFLSPGRTPIVPDTTTKALLCPITSDEFRRALHRLNNGRAAGPDDIPAELLKYAANELAPRLATLLNRSFERGEPIGLGDGILLCLQKPNKPRGECSSLRPIVLLNTIRKAVSLIVLHRITPAVDKFLSSHQSGFRRSRSTADAVWAHKWICARVQTYHECIHVLGIDLSRAFDTIDREKLLGVLETFLQEDDLRLIRLLLSDTTLSLRVGSQVLQPFDSNTGTPQGDSLSPVLFVIYLEVAMRDLASHPAMPPDLLQQMIVYADDADFICRDPALVELIQVHAPEVLARWSLQMNTSKTEHTQLQRCVTPASTDPHARAEEEVWRATRKLGSLLGDAEDVSRRKSLAAAALHRLWTVWIRPHRIADKTRIRLYNCYVLPILLYNCGTWALTPSELRQLESFHRRQLRSVLNVRYPRRIPNAELYEACEERPQRHRIVKARWGLLGHILRRPRDIPAFIQMKNYFAPSDRGKWRGRPRTTLPRVLDKDLIASGCGHRLRSDTDLEALRLLAQDKRTWKALMTTIADTLPAKGDSTYADTTLCRRLAKLRLAQV